MPTRTHSALAGDSWANMADHTAFVTALSRTTVKAKSPWVGQALTTPSGVRRDRPRHCTSTEASLPGVIAMRVSKKGARTTRSKGGCPGTVISRLHTCSPLSTRADTGTVLAWPATSTY